MPKEDFLDRLLDAWEVEVSKSPDTDLGGFLRRRSPNIPARIRQEFCRRAAALAKMDRRLAALDDTGDLDGDTPAPGGTQRKAFRLTIGDEPVAGYRLEECLGEGGFGSVWRATGPGGFPVALKFVHLKRRAGAIEQRSLDIIRGVRHANILSVVGTWRVNDWLIIASELADQTLLDRFKEHQAAGKVGIPRQELLGYMHDAARGIDFLNHAGSARQKIQHRDIKPQNLLLSGGSVKVGDFGLARELRHDSTAHTGSLTLAYAAPEFLAGRTSSRSDQYSLAVTYCHLLGGRLPFAGNDVQIIDGHRYQEPDVSMLPERDRPVVRKALAKTPADRWTSCLEFVQALQSGSSPLPRPVRRKQTTRRSRVGLWGTIALGSIIVIALTWIRLASVPDRLASNSNELAAAAGRTDDTAAELSPARSTAPSSPAGSGGDVVKTPDAAPASPPSDGWTSIFNEKDLTGWSPVGFDGWRVENGILIGESPSQRQTGWLVLDDRYDDFELALEFRLAPGSNSGVFLQATPHLPLDSPGFLEIQLLDETFPRYGAIRPDQKMGGLFGIVGPSPVPTATNGEWHRLQAKASGRNITISVDGTEVVDHDLTDDRTGGHIGLQLYPYRVEFRNIRLRPLN